MGLVLALLASASSAQRSRFDPASSQAAKQHEGFVDFALKQVNPTDKDYGQCLTEVRRIAVSKGSEDSLFWSNIVTLFLFTLSVLVLVYEHHERSRTERVASEILCQYHNGLLRSRRAVSELAAKYNTLTAEINATAESQVRRPSLQSPTVAETAHRESKESEVSRESAPVSATRSGQRKTTLAPRGASVIGVPVQDVDLISSNNALQQQLNLARQREQNLRQQLNVSEQKLEEEKRKNRDLKGA